MGFGVTIIFRFRGLFVILGNSGCWVLFRFRGENVILGDIEGWVIFIKDFGGWDGYLCWIGGLSFLVGFGCWVGVFCCVGGFLWCRVGVLCWIGEGFIFVVGFVVRVSCIFVGLIVILGNFKGWVLWWFGGEIDILWCFGGCVGCFCRVVEGFIFFGDWFGVFFWVGEVFVFLGRLRGWGGVFCWVVEDSIFLIGFGVMVIVTFIGLSVMLGKLEW